MTYRGCGAEEKRKHRNGRREEESVERAGIGKGTRLRRSLPRRKEKIFRRRTIKENTTTPRIKEKGRAEDWPCEGRTGSQPPWPRPSQDIP